MGLIPDIGLCCFQGYMEVLSLKGDEVLYASNHNLGGRGGVRGKVGGRRVDGREGR